MSQLYLEITFRRGRPFAAYYYLTKRRTRVSETSRRIEPGLVVDYAADGQPIGVEITSPGTLKFAAFNRVLEELGVAPIGKDEFEPLRAAS
ncbi:MAG: DUF2283 domain-containing protein [Planctomycetota bacterium]|jgi:hypothetical protein